MAPAAERRLKSQLAAHESWAQTDDRAARTSKARVAAEQRFLKEANGDPVRAEHLRKAHYARMALKSVISRRKAAEFTAAAEAAEAELEETGGDLE